MTTDHREELEKIAAECEAQAEQEAATMLEHKRRMQMLRQRAFILRELLTTLKA